MYNTVSVVFFKTLKRLFGKGSRTDLITENAGTTRERKNNESWTSARLLTKSTCFWPKNRLLTDSLSRGSRPVETPAQGGRDAQNNASFSNFLEIEGHLFGCGACHRCFGFHSKGGAFSNYIIFPKVTSEKERKISYTGVRVLEIFLRF